MKIKLKKIDGTYYPLVDEKCIIGIGYESTPTFTFLHFSDSHDTTYGIEKCIQLMDSDEDISLAVDSGDTGNGSTVTKMKNSEHTFLNVLGNHDTADFCSFNQKTARDTIIYPVCGNIVNMGSDTASYWYKDVTKGDKTIRFIGFDEYEYNNVGTCETSGDYKYGVVYSQAQINWLITLLKNTPSHYYIVMVHHQALAYTRDVITEGDFISKKWYNGKNIYSQCKTYGDLTMIPQILDAYLSKKSINKSFKCGDKNNTMISVNEDFSNNNPAKFLFHLGGHLHWDDCEYHPNYNNQLMLYVSSCRGGIYGTGSGQECGDLTRTDTDGNFCINKITVDFENNKINIDRIGASQYRDTDGTLKNRTNTSFSF